MDKIEVPFDISHESEPRRRILAAAYKIFSQKGLAGARTRQIAELAQVNIAMIHYYFSSKEDLYKRVVTPIFKGIDGRLKRAATSSDDPRKCLEAVVDAYFDFLKTYPEFPRLMMWEMASGGDTFQKILGPILSGDKISIPARISNMFRNWQDKGLFKLHSPEQAAISIIALCVFPFATRKMIDVAFTDLAGSSEFIDERRRHVKDLLIAGLSSGSMARTQNNK